MTRGPALGRGLNALIPRRPLEVSHPMGEEPPEPGQLINDLPIDSIDPNPHQPRRHMSAVRLEELAASITENGILQPLLVSRGENGRFTLIAGERRLRAAERAGLQRVPVHIVETDGNDPLVFALVENIQREDLSPLEEAQAFQNLVNAGLTQTVVAHAVGKSRVAIANSLRLLQLPAPVRTSLVAGEITVGHARAILGAPSEDQQIRLWERVRERNLTVRQTENAAKQLRTPDGAAPPPRPDSPPGDRLAGERLQSALSTKVLIDRRRKGGRIIIHWYDDEQLEQIVNQIATQPPPAPPTGPTELDI